MTPHDPDFRAADLASIVEALPPGRVDALPFGAIRLDRHGHVTFYNETERRLSGYRQETVARSFFTEIAPCMNNAKFRGRIDKAMAAGRLDIAFNFVGDFRDSDRELEVRVQSAAEGGCWIFIRRP